MFSKITKKNWLFFAIKNYNVPNLDSEQEFYEDIKRFKYIKRLFRKYKTTGELKTRLILNHIIVLNNVFGNEASATLLLFISVVIPELKVVSTEPVPPENAICFVVDSNGN